MSCTILLSCLEDSNNNWLCFLADESSWFSNQGELWVQSLHLCQIFVNFWRYLIEIVLFVCCGHWETSTDIKNIHIFHVIEFGQLENLSSIFNSISKNVWRAPSRSNMERHSSNSHSKTLAFLQKWWPTALRRAELFAHWIWSICFLNGNSENKLSLWVSHANVLGFLFTVECHELNSSFLCELQAFVTLERISVNYVIWVSAQRKNCFDLSLWCTIKAAVFIDK